KGTTVGGTMYATQSQINSLIVQLGPITVAPTPAPKLPAGMLPVRATLEAKGYKIVWDAKNKRAVITNPRTKKTINFRGTMAKDTMYATRTQIDMIVRMLGKAAA
ncbi:MAG: stalk domain-containing protein, partial [Desulfotomaculales bacterium]